MDNLENIKLKLQRKPMINKKEDVFVYLQQKKDPFYIRNDDIEKEDDIILEDASEFGDDDETRNKKSYILEEDVNSNTNPKAPIILDERTIHKFDIDNFMIGLRENNLQKVLQKGLIEKKKEIIIEPILEPVIEPPLDKPKRQRKVTEKKQKEFDLVKKEPQQIGVMPENNVLVGKDNINDRLPANPKPLVNVIVSNYYLNNRKKFLDFINSVFEPYKQKLDNLENNITCESMESGNASGDLDLLLHQQVVRDYLNLYTPYRGLLLYHGLGSGKTCSSIAIAEGMKRAQKVIVMTPASLKPNYIEEIKKCGEFIYHRNQFWEWISTSSSPEAIEPISAVLNLPVDYIRKKKGAWFINVNKPSNYTELSKIDKNKKSLEDQLNKMIESKYTFVNFNGITEKAMKELTENYTINPFDDSAVIIDEAHNLISRIVNKHKKESPVKENNRGEKDSLPSYISTKLYHFLMAAKNAKVVLLTGTPIINYPNEFGILFNILRGYIKTWTFNVRVNTSKKIDKKEMMRLLKSENTHDYVDYSPTTKILTITRNPFGFKNVQERDNKGYIVYKGGSNANLVGLGDYVSDDEFEENIIWVLRKNNINVNSNGINISNKKPMPDTLNAFDNQYVDFNSRKIKNPISIQKRILGLTSYFKGAQESLLPSFDKILGKDYHILRIPMSDYQFGKYIDMRSLEKPKKKKPAANIESELFKDTSSSYRIFSRLVCNMAIPDRPFPFVDKLNDLKKGEAKENNAIIEGDALLDAEGGADYKQQLDDMLIKIQTNPQDFLSKEALEMYSPKFLQLLEYLTDDDMSGLHLIYSQFRTMEGITLITEILNFHGFAQFKISKNSTGKWFINIADEDRGKPTYGLYTGKETQEEKEFVRFIYNGEWDKIPDSLATELKQMSSNNNLGEIMKIFMITSSGSEGINLRNTRYVHIMDPYWHPVRAEQVIGRARRICSHKNLPKELQTVEVFVYIMTLKEEHVKSSAAIEIKTHDKSKLDSKKIITTDEYLLEISDIKANLTKQLTDIIKQSAFDCNLYSNENCLRIGNINDDPYGYVPEYDKQQTDAIQRANMTQVKQVYKEIYVNDTTYVYKESDSYNTVIPVYDKDSIVSNEPGKPIIPLQRGVIRYVNYKPVFEPVS